MSDSHIDAMQRALSTRLCLQISLSALPLVKEWMDAGLTRWLDSVPLPPELPSGTRAEFRVAVGSDLSRLTWSAHGAPRGFVPKLSEYLQKCGVGGPDMALLSELGEKLEPELVGTWIRVVDDEIRTGWEFCEVQQLVHLVPQLGRQEATTQLLSWVAEQSIGEFRRFRQSIGEDPFSEIELVLPGDSAADQLAVAATAVASLAGASLPDFAITAMKESAAAEVTVVVTIAEAGIRSVGVRSGKLPMDTAARLCVDAAVEYDNTLAQLEGVLQADGIRNVELRIEAGSGRYEVDVGFVPGVSKKAPDLRRN
jgi:hypothetical protein